MNLPPLKKIETFVFRVPIGKPVVTSFGVMHNRPAVLVRVEDRDHATGWGEIWCNFPTCGAEHRAQLVDTVLAPKLTDPEFSSVTKATSHLEQATKILTLQTGEFGPISQAIAGIDIALWDLAARRAQKPLYALLGGEYTATVPAYASGINQKGAVSAVQKHREDGFKNFKVKIGAGLDQDIATIKQVYSRLKPGEQLMVDANQGWDMSTALQMADALQEYNLSWLEEPVPVDAPVKDWIELSKRCSVPLAGGENIRGTDNFNSAIEQRYLQVFQPDICKWGGITHCHAVARQAIKTGLRYCPHYLGGGIGLVASAHLLAAAGGDGLLEVDVNFNPLRTLLAQPFPDIKNGHFTLPQSGGLGACPDLESVSQWLVQHTEHKA